MSTKTILAIIAGIVVLGAATFFISSQSVTFEVMALDDVLALEQELATVAAQVNAGTIDPEAAAAARVRIIEKLDAINIKMIAAGNAQLTNDQRAQLNEALTRLKAALLRHSDTLVTVDVIASRHSSTSGSSKSLSSTFLDTVDSSEVAIVAADVEIDSDNNVEAGLNELEAETAETIKETVSEQEEMTSPAEDVAITLDEVEVGEEEAPEVPEEESEETNITEIDANVSIEAETPISE